MALIALSYRFGFCYRCFFSPVIDAHQFAVVSRFPIDEDEIPLAKKQIGMIWDAIGDLWIFGNAPHQIRSAGHVALRQSVLLSFSVGHYFSSRMLIYILANSCGCPGLQR
jgi:hypothetical protein